jgi:hypothetical protein
MRLPEFLGNEHMKMAILLALRTGRLYLTGEVEFHLVTNLEGPEGEYKFSYTLSLILALMAWMVRVTPRPLYPTAKRPNTHCTGGWLGRSGYPKYYVYEIYSRHCTLFHISLQCIVF